MSLAAESPPPAAGQPKRRLTRVLRSAWSSVGPGVALLTAVVALTFQLVPGISPDPHTGLTASLAIQAIEPGVTLRDYDARFHTAADVKADVAGGHPDQLGDIVYVRASVQGEKHGEVKLYPVIYDTNPRRASSPTKTQATDAFNPGTPNDQWITPVLVFNPGHDYFVRMTLKDKETILAFVDTPTIKAPKLHY